MRWVVFATSDDLRLSSKHIILELSRWLWFNFFVNEILWLVIVNSSLTVCFVKFGKDLGLQDTITLAALLRAGQWEIQASVCQSHVIDKFNIVYFSSTCICCLYFFIGCVLCIAYFTRICICFWTNWTAVHDSHIFNILYLFFTCVHISNWHCRFILHRLYFLNALICISILDIFTTVCLFDWHVFDVCLIHGKIFTSNIFLGVTSSLSKYLTYLPDDNNALPSL